MSVVEEKKEIYDGLIAEGAPDTYGDAIKGLAAAYNNNRFSYDPATDKAFQDYARMMRKQGSRAAEDTMGKAAAMTGGYGNSYAASAAQGVQNQYLENIDAKAEDFYNQALANFNNRQNQLLTTISLMKEQSDTEKADWQSKTDAAYKAYTDAYQMEQDAFERSRVERSDALELATAKAAYGDYSELAEILGVDAEQIKLAYEAQAISDSAKDLKQPTEDIRREALASLMRKGFVEQGREAAAEDIAARYISLGYSDMSEWLLDEFDNAEYVFNRTWTKSNKKLGRDAEYTDQFGNVFTREELENWATGQYKAMNGDLHESAIKQLVKDFIKKL